MRRDNPRTPPSAAAPRWRCVAAFASLSLVRLPSRTFGMRPAGLVLLAVCSVRLGSRTNVHRRKRSVCGSVPLDDLMVRSRRPDFQVGHPDRPPKHDAAGCEPHRTANGASLAKCADCRPVSSRKSARKNLVPVILRSQLTGASCEQEEVPILVDESPAGVLG